MAGCGAGCAAVARSGARERIRFELADILVYCLCLSNALDLDVSDAVLEKLKLAGQKYRQEDYRGKAPLPAAITESAKRP